MNTPLIIMPDGTRIVLANVVTYTVTGTAIQFTTTASTASFYAWDSGSLAITQNVVQAIDWFVSSGFQGTNPPNILDVGSRIAGLIALQTTTGTAAGGTSVEIDCATSPGLTNFQNGCVVYMNGIACATVWTSTIKITFTTCPQNQGGKNPADIKVVNPDNTSNWAFAAFTWT